MITARYELDLHIFLGALAKLRKATISFVMFIRLSVRMKRFGPQDGGLTKFDTCFFRKSVEKIKLALKFDKNNGDVIRKLFHLYDNISLNSSLNEKCFSHKL
jgi:hypothetical protein